MSFEDEKDKIQLVWFRQLVTTHQSFRIYIDKRIQTSSVRWYFIINESAQRNILSHWVSLNQMIKFHGDAAQTNSLIVYEARSFCFVFVPGGPSLECFRSRKYWSGTSQSNHATVFLHLMSIKWDNVIFCFDRQGRSAEKMRSDRQVVCLVSTRDFVAVRTATCSSMFLPYQLMRWTLSLAMVLLYTIMQLPTVKH